jgi:hypothetical protein
VTHPSEVTRSIASPNLRSDDLRLRSLGYPRRLYTFSHHRQHRRRAVKKALCRMLTPSIPSEGLTRQNSCARRPAVCMDCSYSPQHEYVHWLRRCIRFCGKLHPATRGDVEVVRHRLGASVATLLLPLAALNSLRNPLHLVDPVAAGNPRGERPCSQGVCRLTTNF